MIDENKLFKWLPDKLFREHTPGIKTLWRASHEPDSFFHKRFMQIMQRMPVEFALDMQLSALRWGWHPKHTNLRYPNANDMLDVTLWERHFPNCIGVAPGFDRKCVAMDPLAECGFGFIEVGMITPLAAEGGGKPRVFRLDSQKGLITRTGFPNPGCMVSKGRLQLPRSREHPVGLNMGANLYDKDTEDILSVVKECSPWVDYMTISIPYIGKIREAYDYMTYQSECMYNEAAQTREMWMHETRFRQQKQAYELRKLELKEEQQRDQVEQKGEESWQDRLAQTENDVEREILEFIEKWTGFHQHLFSRPVPEVLLKVSPRITDDDALALSQSADDVHIGGFIVGLGIPDRDGIDLSKAWHKSQEGALVGRPIADINTAAIRRLYEACEGKHAIIASGGVFTGEDAYKRIRAGANLVQLYSAIAFEGLTVANKVKLELQECLHRDGFTHVDQVRGIDTDVGVRSVQPRSAVREMRKEESLAVEDESQRNYLVDGVAPRV